MDEKRILDEENNNVLLSINPKIYSLDVVYTASYVFLERAYVFLDGDPKEEIFVELTPKIKESKENLDILGKEFMNELIKYGFHKEQSEKSKQIRESLLQRALLTNLEKEEETEDSFDDFDDLDEDLDELEDPEGIAIPWEEKYGKENTKNSN